MNFLLLANNVTSATVIISCWWLAHQYARVKPPGRAIAIGLAIFGFNTLFIMFARNFEVPVGWPAVLSKLVLSVVLVLIIVRRISKGDD